MAAGRGRAATAGGAASTSAAIVNAPGHASSAAGAHACVLKTAARVASPPGSWPLVGSPPASLIANRTNYKTSILCGLGLFALGAALFYPAASVRVYGLFLGALLIIGLGLACLETSVSP